MKIEKYNFIKPGMIGLVSGSSFVSNVIKFFTNSKYSHNFLCLFPQGLTASILELSSNVKVLPYNIYNDKDFEKYIIYEVNSSLVSQEEINYSVEKIFKEYTNSHYGFLQLIWFLYKWLMKKLFNKDVRHDKNWFTDGIICSEIIYYFLYNLNSKYRDILKDYNADTIQPADIADIIQNNPHLFKLVYCRNL